jgi:hypothetical protein
MKHQISNIKHQESSKHRSFWGTFGVRTYMRDLCVILRT